MSVLPTGAARAGTTVERPMLPVVHVAELPTVVFGARGVVWWGTIGFMIVETTTLAACVAAYLYVLRNFEAWPPLGTPLPSLGVPTAGLLVLLASMFPTYMFARAARRLDERGTRVWLWIATLVTAVASVLRGLEFAAVNVRWDANAYGSAVWAILVAHFTLLATDVFETGTLAAIFTRGRHEERHFVDATDNAFYSYFMVLAWVPLYVLVYLVPRWV